MLSVSRLLDGTATPDDALRYGRHSSRLPSHLLQFSTDKKPVVVWNVTQRCNLDCIRCRLRPAAADYANELTTDEGRALLDDLAGFGVPTVLFSGGEPLLRDDLFDLVAHARARGLRCVLSTNGTRVDGDTARRIAAAGFVHVGVGFEWIEGVPAGASGSVGAYAAALGALRLMRDLGTRVGLSFTMHAGNIGQLPAVFDLLQEEGIGRCHIHHLACAGRGSAMQCLAQAPFETRRAVEYVFDRAEKFQMLGAGKEISTVDNAADGILLLQRVTRRQPAREREVRLMLVWHGGNQSGIAVSSIDPAGGVHVDPSSWNYHLGNIRTRPFSEIWTSNSDPRLVALRANPRPIKGRCSSCSFLGMCNGNLRARAEGYFADFLAPDPACYLTDAEIGVKPGTREERASAEWPVPVHGVA